MREKKRETYNKTYNKTKSLTLNKSLSPHFLFLHNQIEVRLGVDEGVEQDNFLFESQSKSFVLSMNVLQKNHTSFVTKTDPET